MSTTAIRSIFAALAFAATATLAPAAYAQDDAPDVAPDDAPDVDDAESAPLAIGPDAQLGLGVRGRYVFMPQGVLELFLESAASGVSSGGFGVEVVRRKADFDIVLGLEYDNIAPDDGFYQDQSGEAPDIVKYDGFSILSLDVNFVWSTELARAFHLRYGAGIGIAAVLGDILQTDQMCADPDNFDTCVTDPTGDQNAPSEDVPPVVPIVNVLLGVRYDVLPNLSVNLETGFRDVFFAGLGTTYFF